ncbi:MAG: hypothetical protein EOO09_14075 [Chitinophagaceae bacterium]|nr:MAG: hypothetical protein EOO09_14075 [Chitinophagaceae bacterium]
MIPGRQSPAGPYYNHPPVPATMKKMFLLTASAFFIAAVSFAQQQTAPVKKEGWHLLDPAGTGYLGISLDAAYKLLEGRKSTPVIVAVIDSGIDTAHEDLLSVLWVNTREIPGNGIDDDGNGYVDDIHGWNFCGSKSGENLARNSHEITRVYHNWKKEFEGKKESRILADRKYLYGQWKKAAALIEEEYRNAQANLPRLLDFEKNLRENRRLVEAALGKDDFKAADLPPLAGQGEQVKAAANTWYNMFDRFGNPDMAASTVMTDLGGYIGQLNNAVTRKTTPPEDWRGQLTKDKYEDINDRSYGNNNLKEGSGDHGTLVSGTIGATRGNGIGMDGIAANVRIMGIRAVPGGDEHDKDVALAIRYAVDNGAKVINMSFGKPVSPYKKMVDDAVRYAASKNVLLIHGSGNDGKDITNDIFYPNPVFLEGDTATNYITVGASGDKSTGAIAAPFSNYSKKSVDIFAPGMYIYATATNNIYKGADGTSLACPVATGVAALLFSYFPALTPQQVKRILIETGETVNGSVPLPGEAEKSVPFSSLSVSGKIINAADAVKMAMKE